jgi:T-complex protein 1 subunit zeta
MSAISALNPNADTTKLALSVNVRAAMGLQDVLKTNLGPNGTLKMLVSGGGDIKLTKDGNVLLHQMQISNPTASLIARTATSQDDVCGDGTTSTVLVIGELLKQALRAISEGLHPRVISDGFEAGRILAQEYLETLKIKVAAEDTAKLRAVAKNSLRTKVRHALADSLADDVTDAIAIVAAGTPVGNRINLHMVEIQEMQQGADTDTRLVRGLVLDHGARHPDMPKHLEGEVFVLTCNVSFEYEKSETNAGLFYSSAEGREKMANSERAFVEQRVAKVIALKDELCGDDPKKHFLVVNQKGIDPFALEAFAKAGILALRRAKRRNMERMTLCCGGTQVNSLDDLSADALGKCGLVYEHVLGEDKFTFVERAEKPTSCTLLIKGPTKHSIAQTKDAIRDGLRAVKNTLDDGCVIPGAGAFYVGAYKYVMEGKDKVKGRAKLGAVAFAESLLVIPKTLASNSGLDQIDAVIALQEEFADGNTVGLDLATGDPMDPEEEGIFDGYTVTKSLVNNATVIASQILLVDEMIAAGKKQQRANEAAPGPMSQDF